MKYKDTFFFYIETFSADFLSIRWLRRRVETAVSSLRRKSFIGLSDSYVFVNCWFITDIRRGRVFSVARKSEKDLVNKMVLRNFVSWKDSSFFDFPGAAEFRLRSGETRSSARGAIRQRTSS